MSTFSTFMRGLWVDEGLVSWWGTCEFMFFFVIWVSKWGGKIRGQQQKSAGPSSGSPVDGLDFTVPCQWFALADKDRSKTIGWSLSWRWDDALNDRRNKWRQMSHRFWFQKSHISNFVSTDLVSLRSQMITTKTDGSNELLVTSTSFKGVHGVCFHWGSDEFRFLMDTVRWHVATAGVSERTDLENLRFLKWFFSGQNPLVSFGLEVIRSHKTRHDVRSMPLKLIGASAFGCFLTPSSCRHIPRAHFPQPKIRIRIGRIGPIALWNPMVSKGARSGYGSPLFLLNCKLLGSRQKGLILIPYMVNQIHLESSPRCSPEVKSSHVEFWGPSHPVIQPSVRARLACRCRTPSLGSWRALKGWGWWTWRDHPRRDVSGE